MNGNYGDDMDYKFDAMRDDFLLCASEEEAKKLIHQYGKALADQYLPEAYRYLLKD